MSSGENTIIEGPYEAIEISDEDLAAMPIFPLSQAVLLPGGILPLHIFEPRYREMTRDALAGRKVLALARPLEPELPGAPPPAVAPIIGVGEIVAAEKLEGGRFNLLVLGRMRARILEELPHEKSYRIVRACPVEDETDADAGTLMAARMELLALVDALAERLGDAGGPLKEAAAGTSSTAALADMLAGALPFDPGIKHELLAAMSVSYRIEKVVEETIRLTETLSSSRDIN
jgi:Lon protease-like protein